MFSSLNCGAISCTPTGMPLCTPKPHGTLMPPLPAMLMEMVNTSDRYMVAGSAISPNLNAVAGAVGAKMTSHCS